MFATHILREMVTQRLAWVLVHFVWQGAAVAALLVVTLWLGRVRRPSVRYVFGLIALAAMVACPIVTFVSYRPVLGDVEAINGPSSLATAVADAGRLVNALQHHQVHSLNAVTSEDSLSLNPQRAMALAAKSGDEGAPSFATEPLWKRADLIVKPTDRGGTPAGSSWLQVQLWIVSGWLFGVALFSLRLLLGWFGIWRLRLRAEPVPEWLFGRVRQLAEVLHVTKPLIRVSHRVTEAVAVGFFKPMILLPVAWVTELQPDMIEAVIAHELAHIRRGDLWVNLFQRFVETLLFYHPAVWWLSRRLRIDRELCCDELVVHTLRNPLRYAETLEHIGRLSLSDSLGLTARPLAVRSTLAVSIGSPRSILLNRIRAILNVPSRENSSSGWLAGLIPLTLACLIGWSLISRNTAPASDEPQPSNRLIAADFKVDASPDQTVEAAKDFVVELAASTIDPAEAAASKVDQQPKEIVGRVIGADGKPVTDADVSVFESEERPNGPPPKLVLTTKADADGVFRLKVPKPDTRTTVWAAASGKGIGVRPVVARGAPPNAEGLPDESVPEGSPDRFVIRLQTNAGSVRVIDPANKPVAGVKVSVRLMRTFRLPYDKQKLAAWYEKKTGQPIDAVLATWMEPSHFDVPPVEFKSLFEGATDAQGMVALPGVASDQIRVLSIETENFGRQAVSLDSLYEAKPDGYVFRLSPVGRLEGEVSVDPRVLATGFKLDGFKLSFKTSMSNVARKQVEMRLEEVDRRSPPDARNEYPHVEGRADAVLDASGRFSIPMIAAGFVELVDPLPQDSAFYVDLLHNVRLEPGKTVSLKIPVHKGVLVRGVIRKRGSHEPVAGRSVNLTSFPETHFRTQRTKYVRTDESGRFEGHVQPGLLEYWLNGAVEGFTTVYAFEHGHARASSGMHYRVPDNVDGAELPPLELVPVKTRTGRLLDEKGNAADPNWDVFGYPTESRWQSAHGKTTKEGEFTLSFPEPYPPTSFVARQDSWRAKPNSDMRRHALKIVSEEPFVVQMTGKDRPSPALRADGSPSTVEVSLGIKQTRKERLAAHDREAAKKLVGDWKLTFPKGFVYQTKIEQQPDGLLKLSGAVALNGVYALSRNRLELMETFNDGARDFVWKLQDDGTLKLIEEDHSAGAEYVGALLSRADNVPQPGQAAPTPKKPPANKPKENEDGQGENTPSPEAAVKRQDTPFCGSILRVDRATGIVVIDRGERDGLTLGEKFDVYPKATKLDGFQPSHGVAQIEVTRILGAVSAEARIVLSDEAPGIGDLLHSATWKPKPEPKPGQTGHGVVLSVRGRVMIDGPVPHVPSLKIKPSFRAIIPRDAEEDLKNTERKKAAPMVEIPDDSLVIGKERGIANVAIYLKKAPANWKPIPEPTEPVVIRAADHRFQPHMSIVRVKQPAKLVNEMRENTNIQVLPIKSSTLNFLIDLRPEGQTFTLFNEPEPFPARAISNIHPWMLAWFVALDHPFAAITDAGGRFEIRDLPPGEHHFTVWHERRGYLNKDLVILVEHGEVAEVDLKYTADQLTRREGVPIRPQPNTAAPSAPAPVGIDATNQRAARIKGNDRDAAQKLVGRWMLTLPADFVYQAEFTQLDDGCLKLSGKNGNNLFGKFSVRDGRVELIEPTDKGIIDLVWQVKSNNRLSLVLDKNEVGATYLGAKLERIAAE